MRRRDLIFIIFCSLMICLEGCAMVGNYYFKTVKSPGAEISNKIKIAVIPENWDWTGTPSFLPRAMVTELLHLGFVVIERSGLEKILGEQKLMLQGIVEKPEGKVSEKMITTLDKSSIQEIGNILGVQALLLTYVLSDISGEISKATFRLVDCNSARVLFSTTFIQSKTSPTPIKHFLDDMSYAIAKLAEGLEEVIEIDEMPTTGR